MIAYGKAWLVRALYARCGPDVDVHDNFVGKDDRETTRNYLYNRTVIQLHCY